MRFIAVDCRKDFADLRRSRCHTVGCREGHDTQARNATIQPADDFPGDIVATGFEDDLVEFRRRVEHPNR